MAAAAKPKGLAEALFKVQGEIQKVAKGSTNSHFGNTYASLPDIMDELHPILQKNELLLSQVMDCSERVERPGLRTVLLHVPSGEKIEGLALFADNLNAQQTGSAVTYFRRYGVLSILGIVADDDDGNLASGNTAQVAAPVQATASEPVAGLQPQSPAETADALPAASGGGLGGGVVL